MRGADARVSFFIVTLRTSTSSDTDPSFSWRASDVLRSASKRVDLTHPRSDRSGRVFDRGRDALVARSVRFSTEPTPPVSPQTPAFRFRGGGGDDAPDDTAPSYSAPFATASVPTTTRLSDVSSTYVPARLIPTPVPRTPSIKRERPDMPSDRTAARAPRTGLSSLRCLRGVRFRQSFFLFRDGGETRDARYGSSMTAPMC